MALVIPVYSVCEKCGQKDIVDVQITVDGSIPKDVDLVTSDKLNMIQCSSCGHKSRAKISVYYYSVIAKRAVWYKPNGADELFSLLTGVSPADDIKEFDSWDAFKDEIQKLEKVASVIIKTTSVNMDKLREAYMHTDLVYRNLLESVSVPDKPMFILRDDKCTSAIDENTMPATVIFLFVLIMIIIVMFAAMGS